MTSPLFWYQQHIMDGNPCQLEYLVSSYYNKDDGVFYEYYEDMRWGYELPDDEYDRLRNENTTPIHLGPMTKQEFDTPDPMGWRLEDYLILNTLNPEDLQYPIIGVYHLIDEDYEDLSKSEMSFHPWEDYWVTPAS